MKQGDRDVPGARPEAPDDPSRDGGLERDRLCVIHRNHTGRNGRVPESIVRFRNRARIVRARMIRSRILVLAFRLQAGKSFPNVDPASRKLSPVLLVLSTLAALSILARASLITLPKVQQWLRLN